MIRRALVAAGALLVVTGAQGAGPPSTFAKPPYTVTLLGTVLGPSDFGVPAGQPVADASAARLPDGRTRIYVFAQGQGVRSAISSDGVHFTVEPGSRLPDGRGMPRIVQQPDGTWRLFVINGGGIGTATSADGLTFTEAAGLVLRGSDAGMAATSGPAVVRLRDGRYRMYFSDLPQPGGSLVHEVKSATSSDLLSWSVEAGTRMSEAEHPFALAHADGSVTLLYYRATGGSQGLWLATSTDGLTFTGQQKVGIPAPGGNDPDAVLQPDGSILLYYGDFQPGVGGTVKVAKLTSKPTTKPKPKKKPKKKKKKRP